MAVLSLGWCRVGLALAVQITWATLRKHIRGPVSQLNRHERVKT
jgi:hypothetical protein